MSPSPANPLVDHIDQKFAELHPLAQAALKRGLLTGGIPNPGAAPPSQSQTTPMGAVPTAAPTEAPAPLASPAAARPIVSRETPSQTARIAESDRLQASPSGIAGIKNPWARIPLQITDAVGSGLLPGVMMGIPGTQLHHQVLVHQARKGVEAGEKQQTAESSRAQTEAQTEALPAKQGLEEAQAREADARVTSLLHPEAKTAFQGWRRDNPTKPVEEFLKAEGAAKPLASHNEQPFDAWRKDNPHEPVEKWLQLEAANKPESVSEFNVFKKAHPELNGDQLVREYAKAHQAPQRPEDHGQNVVDPATHKLIRVQPGQAMPEGAQTVAGVNSANTPTAQNRGRAEFAKTVVDRVPDILSQVDALKEKIGPTAGRWNQMWVNRGGMDDPDFAGLDQDLKMYASAVVVTHFGARGGGHEYREALEKNFGEAQSPEDLKARIQHANEWIKGYANIGKGGAGAQGSAQVPTISSKAEYDKLPSGAVYLEDGKKYKKP